MNKKIVGILIVGLFIIVSFTPVIIADFQEKPIGNSVILFEDDFNDNTKDYGKWTEIFFDGIWDEINQRTEFQVYEAISGHEGIQSSQFSVTLTSNQGIIVSWDIISDIGSTGSVGDLFFEITDGTNWIYGSYYRWLDYVKFQDSNDGGYTVLKTRGDGTWSNQIQIFIDKYKVIMDGTDSGWISDSLFSSNPTFRVKLYLDVGGTSPSLYTRSGIDDVIVETIGNQPPVADADGPYYGNVDENIYLDGSGSYDSDGSIELYEWDLDDDGQYDDAMGIGPSWSWSTGGGYPISLKVTDDEDATDTDDTMVYINEYPVADPGGPYYGLTDESIILDGSGSFDSDGSIELYEWDLDDDMVFDDATGVSPSWSWSESGSYTIGLRVTDDDDATDTDTSEVFIELDEYPPYASFTYEPENPKDGDTVFFDASGSNDPDGEIVSYSWDFDDESTGSGMLISHVYSEPASYTVVLTVVDDDDNFDTASAAVEVGTEDESPVAYFTFSPVDPCVNETILFNASASFSPDGIIESYTWFFGDDTMGTGMIISHNFTMCRSYSVNLTVCDNHGLNGSVIKIVRVDPLEIPYVLIEGIGGGFGVSVYVNNTGLGDAFDVNWSVDVEADFAFILSGSHTGGVIDELVSGGSIVFESDGLRGIGWITITVEVADAVKQATAFLLGPLVLRVNEL